jgi:mediator of RNA polymerase II transcription subunit 20
MPVKWLFHWQPNVGSQVSSQTLSDVFKRIDSLHATKSTRWQITASQYRPNVRDQALPVDCARELLGVTFTEAPDKIFFVLRQEHMVVEADATMQAIMERLQVYRNRLTVLFEGFQYELGDFRVKAGRAVLAPVENLRGIIMEVEYMPVSSLEQSRAAVLEFMELWQEGVILGQFVPLELNFTDFSLSDHYCWQHTALQYVSLMAFFLSQQRT